jgi:hypothetical protein
MKLLPRGRLIAAAGIMALGVVLVARGMNSGHPARVSLPIDWSHRHVVFSQPATALQARQLEKEPRYWQQMARRNAAALGRVDVPGAEESEERIFAELRRKPRKPKKSLIQRDWAESLGPGATTGTATFPQYPAKFTYGLDPANESCSDYVVFPTNVVGVTGTVPSPTGQPSVIAYQNLYAGAGNACPLGPTIAWAYNTNATGDTTGVVSGSPLISADGTKVAFVESNTGGSVLHLLQFTLGDGTDPTGALVLTAAPANQLTSGSGWSACPGGASCMISLTFTTGLAGNASPFYNFDKDELYVGDDSGVLHKFSGVFNGTPTEVTTGWPITVHAGAALTPAVFDSVTNNLFVGDSTGLLSFVMDTGSTTGSCLIPGAPPCLGSATIVVASTPIIDSPMLDPTTGEVFLFVGDSGLVPGVAPAAYVLQANMDLSVSVRKNVGVAGAPLHSGAFDNAYLLSSPGSTTGSLYVCGKDGVTDQPTVRRISFNTDGTLNAVDPTVLQVGSTTGAAGQCSSVTEIFNPNAALGGRDFIFFSVQSGGVPANCTGAGNGCVMSAVVTAGIFPASIDASLAEVGGTSGIIIDNVGTQGGDSSIYFSRLGQSTLGNCGASGATLVGCAVKLTQAALQ